MPVREGERPEPPSREDVAILGRGRALWWSALAVALLLLAVFLTATLVLPEGPGKVATLGVVDLLKSIFAAVAMFCAAWRLKDRDRPHASAWFLMGLAYTSYTLGDAGWVIFRVGLDQGPWSIVEFFFYLCFYPLFLAGALGLPKDPLNRRERMRLMLDMSTMILAASLMLWSVLFQPTLAGGGHSLRVVLLLSIYPIGDLALLWALMALVFRRKDWGADPNYLILSVSTAILIATDFRYVYQYVFRLTSTISWVDLGWTASFLIAGMAAFYEAFGRGRAERPARLEGEAQGSRFRQPETLSLYASYGCMAVAGILVIFQHLDKVTVPAALVITGMLVLVFVRQRMGLRDNAGLYKSLQEAHGELEQRVVERTAELRSAIGQLEAEVQERTRAEERLQRQLKELLVLSAVARATVEARDPDELLARATQAMRDLLYPDNCGVLLLDDSESMLRHAPSYHIKDSRVVLGDVPVTRGVVGRVTTSGKPQIIPDVSKDPDYFCVDPAAKSELCVPLKVGERVLGVLDAESAQPEAFNEDDERVLTTLASQIATALDRMRTEGALQKSEERFRTLVQNSHDIITIHGADGRITYESPSAARIMGYGRDTLVGENPLDYVHPEDRPSMAAALERVYTRTDQGVPQEYRFRHADGHWVYLESLGTNLMDNPAVRGVVMTTREISERRQAQEALASSEERFRSLVQNSSDVITIHDAEGKVVYESPSAARILGYAPGFLMGKNPFEFVHPDDMPAVMSALRNVATKSNTGIPTEYRLKRGDGTWTHVESVGNNMMDNPAVGGLVLTSRVINERKEAETRIKLQIKRLAALRDIDSAINSSLDLQVTLRMFLEHALTQLNVDAADILLLEMETGILTFAAARGFRSVALEHSRLALGESYAGTAAKERRVVIVNDLKAAPNGLSRSPHLSSEGFSSYAATPLLAKGRVTGVLEVFSRGPLDADGEWTDFLETLAGQAAIAIDNRTLFDRTQRANLELANAYETTLEGWSHALELRDRETQGHTLRVAETTLKLARAVGVGGEDLIHIRRGALLHDIGKMGIPDMILLKPGPLTEEEWAVMRRHTMYAHELLSPIPFLRPALDIPWCHHERWDGSGYPRGLKGEEIPLSARIFSVVDSWDALSYERPYRQAWPAKRVRDYLREKAGSHFEPRLVEAFLDLSL